jgi:hypothetical protein
MPVTDYTDPATIDVNEVIANISHDYRMRGQTWTDHLSWPNVTVMALANEVQALRLAAQGWAHVIKDRAEKLTQDAESMAMVPDRVAERE